MHAQNSGPLAAILIGDAGVGKTWLADRFAADVGPRGVVLRIDAGATSPAGPFSPLLQMITDYWDALADRGADTTAAELGAAVRRGARAREIRRVFAAMISALTDDAGPVVIVVDRVDNGNHEMLDLLAHCVRRNPERPLFAIAITRDVDSISDFLIATDAVMVPVEPLLATEASELVYTLTGSEDDDLVASITERGQGNPLFLIELAAASATAEADAPAATLGLLITRRIAKLPDDDLQLLRTVALLGPRPNLRFASLAAGLDPDDPTVVSECVDEGLVVLDADSTISFTSPVIPEVTLAATPMPAQRELHNVIANLLILAGGPDHDIARHACAASVPGDELAETAIDITIDAAGTAVETGNCAEALRLVDEALGLAPDAEAEAELLTIAGNASLHLGEITAAMASFERALAIAGSDAAELGLARVLQRSGQLESALAVFERCTGPGADRGRSELLLSLGRVDEAESAAHTAVELARTDGDASVLASALADAALTEAVLMRPGAVDSAEESVRIWRTLGEDSLDWPPLYALGVACESADQFSLSLRALNELRSWTDARGVLDMIPRIARTQTISAFMSGSWGEAEEAIAAALDARRSASSHELGSVRAAAAALAALRGDTTGYESNMSESRSVLRHQSTPFDRALCTWWTGHACLARRKFMEAQKQYLDSLAAFRRIGARDFEIRTLPIVISLLAGTGRISEAQQHAHEYGLAAVDNVRPSTSGDALLIAASMSPEPRPDLYVEAAEAYGAHEQLVAMAFVAVQARSLDPVGFPSELEQACLAAVKGLGPGNVIERALCD